MFDFKKNPLTTHKMLPNNGERLWSLWQQGNGLSDLNPSRL